MRKVLAFAAAIWFAVVQSAAAQLLTPPFAFVPRKGGGPASITSVNLSNTMFLGGSSSGTVIGAIGVTMSSSGLFTGTLALVSSGGGCTGGDTTHFQISGVNLATTGLNLATNGTVANGSYTVCIQATQGGAGGSPFTQSKTVIGSTQISEDEFVGPFSSWTDVKAICGAAANGSTNDTAAIQTCFNGLSASTPTVYFPAGTYPVGLTATASAAASANSLTGVTPTTGIVAGEVVTGGGLPDGTMVGPTYTTGSTVPLVCQTPPCTGSGFSGATVGFSPALHGLQYINVIGADPGTVTWKYVGPSGGTILYINGVGVSLFSRMTLDGQNIASLVVDQSWYGSGNYADSGNQYSDMIFENAATGFQCGILTQQCSETVMLRDQFLNFTDAGAHIWNFNALDTFFWYCLFQGNQYAISNNPGAGAFHAYNSVFINQTTRDIELGNDGVYSFRYNYASGTPVFLVREPSGGATAVTFQGNTILEAEGPWLGTQGPLIMLNNSINAGACLAAFAGYSGFAPSGNIFSMNNTYTGALTSSCATSSGAGTFHSFGDAVVGSVTGSPPPLPVLGTAGVPTPPPNHSRTIFDVTPTNTSGDAGNIAAAITSAIAAGSKNVVHLKPGPFDIISTIQVPVSDIQIIGDGNNTKLNWGGSGAGPVIQLLGPGNKATLLNFAVVGNATTNGIEADGLDQAGSEVYTEQLNPVQSITNLFVDALDYTRVELHNFYPSFGAFAASQPAVVVTGGPSASGGAWLGGATNIFGGAYSGNYINFGASAGAHLVNRDTWNDICCGQIQEAAVSGPSVFTYSGAAIHLTGGSTAINFNNLTGIGALVGVGNDGGGTVTITGTSGANAEVLSLGVLGPSSSFFTDTSSPTATKEFLAGFNGTTLLSETGCCDLNFLNSTLNQLLTSPPSLRTPSPAGVTDLGIYRVSVQNALTAIHLKN